jgi:hypothetical protein
MQAAIAQKAHEELSLASHWQAGTYRVTISGKKGNGGAHCRRRARGC